MPKTKVVSALKGLTELIQPLIECVLNQVYHIVKYTAKDFGQQADSKRLTEVRTASGYKSAHATVFSLKCRSTVCCPMYGFFPMIIACIIPKYYFLDFH